MHIILVFGLSLFLLANFLNNFYESRTALKIASICFILGKLFYVVRFFHNQDFKLRHILPFLGIYLLYMFAILTFILDNLGSNFFLILLFLFSTLLALQFAILRKEAFDKHSFKLVLFGVLFLLIADTTVILSNFYKYFFLESYVAITCYALGHFLVIIGLLKEKQLLKST